MVKPLTAIEQVPAIAPFQSIRPVTSKKAVDAMATSYQVSTTTAVHDVIARPAKNMLDATRTPNKIISGFTKNSKCIYPSGVDFTVKVQDIVPATQIYLFET